MTHPSLPPAADTPFDLRRRFVRLTQVRADGFVEFDYAVGDPELSVELILPAAAFREFCAAQGVEPIGPTGVGPPAPHT